MIALTTLNSRAEFYPDFGALCTSLVIDGQELFYLPDGFDLNCPQEIAGGSPFLFPICGRLEHEGKMGCYELDGEQYEMPLHGFAHLKAWEVVHQTNDSLSMRLGHDDETLFQYPFEFEVILNYRLTENGLICDHVIRNLSAKPMPFYAGFHPYLLIPQNQRQGASLDFKADQALVYNKNLTGIVDKQTVLETPVGLESEAYNECLHTLAENKKAILQFADGRVLSIEASERYDYLQLYTVYDEPFICIEHWMSHPGALNAQMAKLIAPGREIVGFWQLVF